MITIIFLPHILCLTAFLPLERLLPTRRGGRARREPARGEPAAAIIAEDRTRWDGCDLPR